MFQNNLNYASTSNIREGVKFYNLGDKTFGTDFRSLFDVFFRWYIAEVEDWAHW